MRAELNLMIDTMPTHLTWKMGFNLTCLTMNPILMIGKTLTLLSTFQQFTMDTACRMNLIEVIQATHGYVSKTILDQETLLFYLMILNHIQGSI